MVIDIIDLNDEAYRNLSSVQLAMVRAAQSQKNKIMAQAAADKETLLKKLLSNAVARSSVRDERNRAIDEDAERRVEVVREDLRYQLAYESNFSDGNEFGPYRYPENPNYNLAYPQRFLVVRDYYMHVTTDARARLEAYAMDSLARAYLGEYYQPLYELLASYVR